MTAALIALLPETGAPHRALDALDAFIGHRLHEAGIWDSARRSDGIRSYRVRERSDTRVRVSGHLWTIDQTVHAYWLDLEREAAGWRWTLYYDLDASLSERKKRDAFDLLESPDGVAWGVTLEGSLDAP